MFTGIVEELGSVVEVEPLPGGGCRLRVKAATVVDGTALGDSIAVNGVCLTVSSVDGGGFAADVMPETLRRTDLGRLGASAPVNLERAVTPATRLGGHLVQGHVDAVATVRSRDPRGDFDEIVFDLPATLARYVAEKGSICVSGVSLTVVGVGADDGGHWFSVALIPTTLRVTTLGTLQPGDPVNLEVDVMAKYVERILSAPQR